MATFVTATHDEDGVASALEKFVLDRTERQQFRLEIVDRDTFHSTSALMGILAECVYQPTEEKMDHILKHRYGQPGAALYALYAANQCVAVAGVQRTDGGSAELMHIAVAPARRSGGLGRMLVDRLMKELALQKLVAETDADAVGFYRSCGFSIESLGEKYPGVERFLCGRCHGPL